jgi:hypothetical protein
MYQGKGNWWTTWKFQNNDFKEMQWDIRECRKFSKNRKTIHVMNGKLAKNKDNTKQKSWS